MTITKKQMIIAMSVITVILTVFVSLSAKKTVPANVNFTSAPYIIIDAGHGGFDGGASGADGTLEKDINLSIALKVNSYLKKAGQKTVLVRDCDEAVNTEGDNLRDKKKSDIHNRHALQQKYENSVYLCIHQNHFGQTSVKGAQIFYSQNDDISKDLASLLQQNIKENLQNDNNRQIKPITESVYVVSKATVPAVLIECGFLSNSEDLQNLKNEKYQLKLSKIISDTVCDFIK
ncbi:MAG: N-acetylmuramoyl-L-alanine amidase [Acutalibacteraceae bacterium]|nr:N-acetylmuramoyl-L-alanine amidase [Acutalibacteraceae bacterium]